jgi:hypothetical protein
MAHSNNAVSKLLKRPIAFHRILARISDSVAAGLMLSQAVYWTGVVKEKQKSRRGWFFKTQNEWSSETCLSRLEQEGSRSFCARRIFWPEDRRGQAAHLWLRPVMERLAIFFSPHEKRPHSSLRKNHIRECGESTDQYAERPRTITRTTAESTSDNDFYGETDPSLPVSFWRNRK